MNQHLIGQILVKDNPSWEVEFFTILDYNNKIFKIWNLILWKYKFVELIETW